jgi:MoxR-like ATPase
LYNYDAVGRLRDAQLAASGRLRAEQIQRIDDPTTYIRWGPVGRAFQQENRTVVLIDEIDKADIDFPNDLLLELDERRFIIEETGQEIEAKAAPIVLITSNDEKDLPDAFLRRCLFHYVEFPSRERLREIINSHFPAAPPALLDKAVARFLLLRQEMGKYKGEASKKVSTSELIDWFRVLRRYPQDEVLAKLEGKIPYAGVLLKSWDDHVRYLNQNRGRE